jgi:hypothetical protein
MCVMLLIRIKFDLESGSKLFDFFFILVIFKHFDNKFIHELMIAFLSDILTIIILFFMKIMNELLYTH